MIQETVAQQTYVKLAALVHDTLTVEDDWWGGTAQNVGEELVSQFVQAHVEAGNLSLDANTYPALTVTGDAENRLGLEELRVLCVVVDRFYGRIDQKFKLIVDFLVAGGFLVRQPVKVRRTFLGWYRSYVLVRGGVAGVAGGATTTGLMVWNGMPFSWLMSLFGATLFFLGVVCESKPEGLMVRSFKDGSPKCHRLMVNEEKVKDLVSGW